MAKKNMVVTVDDGGRIYDYLLTSEDADKVAEALEEVAEVNIIPLSSIESTLTAEQIIELFV